MLKHHSLYSWLLVLGQMACLAFLAATGPFVNKRVDFQIWELTGLFLMLSGLLALNWHSFSVFPEPKAKGRLIRNGIFAFIRHPMYAGLLLIAGTLVWEFWSWPRVLAWGLLLILLVVKIVKEEHLLQSRFPDYHAYMQNTNRLIPFVW